MSSGAWAMVFVTALTFGSLGFLIVTMLRSIRHERTAGRSLWREFGLSIVLVVLFFTSWVGQGVAQWQRYTDEQRAHHETVEIGDFVSDFGASTLENWQSEFLQLFSFVTLAALFVHKGSSESKDGDEKMEASLRRIEEKLGTLPEGAPRAPNETWKLPDAPRLSG